MPWIPYLIALVTMATVNVALPALVPDRAAPPKPQMPPSPRELILGDWRNIHTNGILRITPTETIFISAGKIQEGDGLTATHTIDWTRNPTTIELRPRAQPERVIPGVLKLEGDRLELALRTFPPAVDRDGPVDFNNADLRIDYVRVKR